MEDHSPRKFHKSQKYHKNQRDYSSERCYNCHKVGHIARKCPLIREKIKKGRSKIHNENATEDDEPVLKKERNNDSDEEYVLISTHTRTIPHGNDTWLVDNGASNHMTSYKYYLIDFIEKESHQKVKLGDDYQYPIKGVGEASYKLEYGKKLKMKDVLCILGLKKSLLSISGLEKKGYFVVMRIHQQ